MFCRGVSNTMFFQPFFYFYLFFSTLKEEKGTLSFKIQKKNMVLRRSLFCSHYYKSSSTSCWRRRTFATSHNNKITKKNEAFSIYIHWPYCESKCTYCNFNKYVNPSDPPVERLTRAMIRELEFYLSEPRFGVLHNKRVTSIYFGGGTPSLAKPSTISRILQTVNQHISLDKDIEITLEANPTSSELARLRDFRDAGINRLSLGIQSFNDVDLKLLGRDHSASSAIRTLEEAKKLFPEVTFDMIFARPRQSLEDWQRELKQTLDLAGNHLSMYQLSFERGTPLWKFMRKGQIGSVDPELAADMYEETVRAATHHGFTHYEVSSYAKSRDAISAHNFSYWQGLDYIGIGPGAHGRLTDNVTKERIRTFGEFHPDRYMALCESEGEGIRKWSPLSPHDSLQELVVFGLRTRMGIPRYRYKKMTGQDLENVIDREFLDMCVRSNFLIVDNDDRNKSDILPYIPKHLEHEWEQGGIRPTEQGLERMDSILPKLLHLKQ
ncbi:hypothetical protein BDB00DRAFT_859401 [Zychaea mexicana]|uniref:uncharacterized protein n=1 Tax=Zychaea mexicana TaxID=64656 RepID=UPI0022FE7FFD|nr:uncharacterized protein BDB00DRAFT_859401 [Zychaea mexicana]KAI9477098.1 hypothetical protein BDB00DRAFT_859401 [Zychaea mexicana]